MIYYGLYYILILYNVRNLALKKDTKLINLNNRKQLLKAI